MSDTDSYDVPAGESPVECPRCGAPFCAERYRDLHLGLEHPDDLDDDQVERYREAYREEGSELRLFRLLALAALVAVYFGLLVAYAAFA